MCAKNLVATLKSLSVRLVTVWPQILLENVWSSFTRKQGESFSAPFCNPPKKTYTGSSFLVRSILILNCVNTDTNWTLQCKEERK